MSGAVSQEASRLESGADGSRKIDNMQTLPPSPPADAQPAAMPTTTSLEAAGKDCATQDVDEAAVADETLQKAAPVPPEPAPAKEGWLMSKSTGSLCSRPSATIPVAAAWCGAMEGPLIKHNTSHGGSEYAKKVYCVLAGYTLFEFDSEQEARAMLWPRAEADVIGVSPAPSNSAALRSTSLSMTSRTDNSVTFVYTTNAGERVCAVASSPRECERWIVALTLGVELLLLSGLPEAAGGAAQCVAHAPPMPETNATHCAGSGQQFGYTVTRHMCSASGRAFSAAHMAPASIPLPGIGLAHAARVSDACAQAQQLLNASRIRTRLLAAAVYASELEAVLLRKYKIDGRELWLRHARTTTRKRAGAAEISERDDAVDSCYIASENESEDELRQSRKQRDHEVSTAAHASYVTNVLDPAASDPAALILELHHLCSKPPQGDDPDNHGKSKQRTSSTDAPTVTAHAPEGASSTQDVPAEPIVASSSSQEDEEDVTPRVVLTVAASDAHSEMRTALSMPAHTAAVRDTCAALAEIRAADDDKATSLLTRRNLLFYLPQLAHVYYRLLPPRDADAAVRATLVEDLLLRASRRSFKFALRLAWYLVAYLEDRGAVAARRPHVLRLLVELEAAAAYSYAGTTDALGSRRRANGGGDPWTLRSDTVSLAAMARRGPVAGEPSPFAGAVAIELLPRAPAWLALELRRAAVALHRSSAKVIDMLGMPNDSYCNLLLTPCTPSSSQARRDSAQCHDAPDDVLAREMRFVRAMCDVAETMRGVELSQRSARLKYELQALPRRTPLGHSPIGPTVVRRKRQGKKHKSGRVARIPPNEGHVFKTKARAPTLVLLETVDDAIPGSSSQQSKEDSKEAEDDAAADAASRQRDSMRALLAPALESGPPLLEDDETDEARASNETDEARASDETGIARRVASMPRILEAAYNAAQDDDDDTTSILSTSTISKSAAAPAAASKKPSSGGPRRSSSMTSLAALPENPKRMSTSPPRGPKDGSAGLDDDADEDVTEAHAEEGDATDREGARLAAELVASRSAARAEVVRALRQRATLGLKPERLASLDGPPTGVGESVGVSTVLPGEDDEDDFEAAIAATAPKKDLIPGASAHPQLLLPTSSGTDDLDSYAKAKRLPGFGEPWVVQRERVRRASPIGDEPSWNLVSLIVKSNDDLRQEVCALQIIAACNDAFEAAGLSSDADGLWLRHYSIVPTGASTGIIETMADAVSLDALKKNSGVSLPQQFQAAHGQKGPVALARARKAFISSMAAYSLVCYVLGLKDRHNGNILLDSFGHVIHIDFGFMLGQAPGGSFSLERVPFKLTNEFVETMGGWNSDGFADFVVLLACGFAALQAHSSKIIALVEIMAKDSFLPCFRSGASAVDKMRSRFKLNLTTNQQVANHVAELVKQSYNAYGTRQYDSFQYFTNGIYS